MGLLSFLQRVKNYFTGEEWTHEDAALHETAVLYIAEGQVLPSPLEASEEAKLLETFETTEGEEKLKARAILIERNLRLVVFVAKKFLNSNYSMDDLISIGSIGLIKAINSFKQDKNIKLATYAARCIENEILMFFRKNQKTKREISMDEPLKVDESGGEISLADIIESHDDEEIYNQIGQSVERKILHTAISNLNKREQEIMFLRFGLGGQEEKTQKEVADFLNISQSYISRLEKKIMSKLKKELGKRLDV